MSNQMRIDVSVTDTQKATLDQWCRNHGDLSLSSYQYNDRTIFLLCTAGLSCPVTGGSVCEVVSIATNCFLVMKENQ